MPQPLKILIAEDNPLDAELVLLELGRAGFAPEWERVETEEEYLAHLHADLDIVLSDFLMPQFSGLRALELLKQRRFEVPFILVSGTIGEEIAVMAMQQGATDYLLKDRLARLGPAVSQALAQGRARRERRHAEEALRASEERFRQLAENIHEVFWITNPTKTEILYISPAYEKIWGRTCESLYAEPHTWIEAIHADDRGRIEREAPARQAIGTYDLEYRILRPNGAVRWIRDRAFSVRNVEGEINRLVGVAEDITERKQLEEEFRQMKKMEAVGQLSGGIAHDFNNMLTVIQGHVGLLMLNKRVTLDIVDSLREILGAADRAANLTRQLLMFSRRQAMQLSMLDLNQTVASVAKMIGRILGEDVGIQLRPAPEPMLVRADTGMIEQIIMNLAVNARDAMPLGGRLVIETSGVELSEQRIRGHAQGRPGWFVCLRVIDTGLGIAPEILPRIFEPFFTTKDVGKGTGLGLATVYGIAQQHEGWVEVESELGQGTTFTVFFPRQQGAAPFVAAHETVAVERGHETILLVEDESPVRVLVEMILQRQGYRVLSAANGMQALALWQENHAVIDLLLTDVVMPDEISGRELAKRLHILRPELRVIYMSGYIREKAGADFPLKEGFDFIPKPFKAGALLNIVRARLDAPVSKAPPVAV